MDTISIADWQLDPLDHFPKVSSANIIESMGIIPDFITRPDVSAIAQVHGAYAAHGGWRPLPGWIMESNGVLTFPGDRPEYPAALLVLPETGEAVRFYPRAWMSVRLADDTYQVARID